VDNFAAIEPYAIDSNGRPVGSNVLDRIYTPNNQMSAYDFREALALFSLVMDKTYLRVHHKGTRITAESITGFTFLEGVSESIMDGKVEYKVGTRTFTPDEVMVIKNVNPYHLHDGYSSAKAAQRWTTLDDYIADYQSGFFRNGAVPAGQFVITARTATEFKDIVDKLQERHRGATNNNAVTYTHRPTDATGTPLNSQIEWIPFSVDNKDLSLKDLFEQVNRKVDSVYGVPASMRADNTANTYASVRTDELIFAKYRLRPFALKIWSKFTHELNRVTGGAGVGITFDLELPQIVDEEKVRAEAKSVEASLIRDMMLEGWSLDSIVTSFDLSNSYKLLRKGMSKPTIDNDKPQVLSDDNTRNTPDQPVDEASTKKLSTTDRKTYEEQLFDTVKERMVVQVQNAIANYAKISKKITSERPVDTEEDELMTEDMLAVLVNAVYEQGAKEQPINLQLILEAGFSADGVPEFEMNAAQQAKYRGYVAKVATGYNDQTAEAIRSIIVEGKQDGLTATQIKKNLSQVLEEEYRITRLAVTEVNRAGNEASLMSMQNIAEATGAKIEKEWVHEGGDTPCEYCQAMIGTTVPLNDNFVDLGQTVRGVDGGELENTFVPIDIAEIHPNGHCRQVYRVIR
jgi:phage portal protein BeeE